jgi:transposase
MAFKRLSMRKIHLVLRLFFAAEMSIRAISRTIKASPSTVGDYIRRAEVAGLSWPLPEGLDERALEARLFPAPEPRAGAPRLPDWAHVHRELKRKGVTRSLLWQEYKAEHPDGIQYSQFCVHYQAWTANVDVVMRQHHRAGEKLFVDYAGHTVAVIDRATGEVREAQVFVAVLGASNYTFAEATWTQSLADWCASHVRVLRFIGGAPEVVVPDNLRSAVTTPHLYEPDLNPTYADLAEHYGLAIVPARVRRPRDKAKAEAGVLLVERWILAALRNRTFFSLAELNAAIAELLVRLN